MTTRYQAKKYQAKKYQAKKYQAKKDYDLIDNNALNEEWIGRLIITKLDNYKIINRTSHSANGGLVKRT